jgi:hypothetical protein
VHTEDFVIHHGTDGEDIEAKSKLFPYLDIVSPFALVVEAVHPVDGLALMVTSQQKEVLRILNFVR